MQQNKSIFEAAASATPSSDQCIQQLNREMLSLTMAERRRRWKDYLRRLDEIKNGNAASLSSSLSDAGLEQSPVPPQRKEIPVALDHW